VPRLIVLDALAIAYRAYYAFIRRPLVNSRGENTSALFGFGNTALKIRLEQSPDYWALAWDGPGPTFRHERFPDYKATRKPMPADLLLQMAPLEELAQALGLPLIEIPGVEADDVMGTLARRAERDGYEAVLVTGDKDMLQLVTDRVRLLTPAVRGDDYQYVDRDAVHRAWGVAPEQTRDVLALMGDTSDNVPGVPGVGEKTAVELIAQFGTIDALYERIAEVKRDALRQRLLAHREQALLSRELVTIRTDLDLALSWDDLRLAPIRREGLLALARRYELARLERVALASGTPEAEAGRPVAGRDVARRGTAAETLAPGVKLQGEPSVTPAAPVGAREPATPLAEPEASNPVGPPGAAGNAAPGRLEAPSFPREAIRTTLRRRPLQPTLDLWSASGAESALGSSSLMVTPEEVAERIHEVRARALHGLALVPIAGGGDPRRAHLAGLALGARDGTACYVPIGHATGPNVPPARLREWLAPALADREVPKFGEDLKNAAHLLEQKDLALGGLSVDVHLASFLCDPSRRHDLKALAQDFLGESLGLESPRDRGKAGPEALPVEHVAPAAERMAAALFPLGQALRDQLEARAQWGLYETLELPLVAVLFDMERTGIRVDPPALRAMGAELGERIAALEGELRTLAGEEINWDSGPQVARVLFETLKLKPGGKTQGGALSTRADVLEELAESHPFPARLLEYRTLSKLKSTYLDALPEAVDPRDGRVHTTFEQTGAATGRLSSSNPNLQNIPMRTAQGREIRRAFVAAPGASLVGADYSQIELRVMAHLAEDPRLIEAFHGGEDVHASTARQIFGIDGPVDPVLRARAKIVNFGIMYGMGARSLSQQMGIGLAEAREFIAHYFRVYGRVRSYLDGTLEEARRRGYVETLLGRRRYLPGLASMRGAERSFAERAAINTPIQGSAADLVKLAMIRVHHALKQHWPSARLLLQVHDELLFECPSGEADGVSETVRAEMEGCFALRVPLTVSVGRGRTWFDVH